MNNMPGKPKVLIVDDNSENIIAMERLLKKVEVEVVKAYSGNEALSCTLYHEFALIILDVQMPVKRIPQFKGNTKQNTCPKRLLVRITCIQLTAMNGKT